MATIALIGGDGAGKTTVARKLEQSGVLPLRYLYMGINLDSSNAALPTSRLVSALKRRKSTGAKAVDPCRRESSPLRNALRLGYRLSEEWYRQLLSWWYQLRGWVVLYDRHFLFDFAPAPGDRTRQCWTRRLHFWLLRHCYPKPALTIFLDSPPEVLMARKGEASVAFLEGRRNAFLAVGRRTPNFYRIDGTLPLPVVYQKVCEIVCEFVIRGDRRQPGRSAALDARG